MTTPGQPLADVSEFALPGRMRELAARIRWDLFNPCRQQMANAEKKRSDAIKGADQVMASVEAKFGSIRDEQNAKQKQVHSSVSSAVSELNQICAAAEAHLKSEGVELPPVATPVKSDSETPTTPPLDLADLLGRIGPKKTQLQNFCQKKKVEYWPKTTGARWGFVILSIILFFIFKPLVFLLPGIVFLLRLQLTTSLKREYAELAEGSKKLQFSLQALESRHSKEMDGVIKASSESLIPPAKKIYTEAITAANQRFKADIQKIENDFRQVAEQLHTDENQLWEDSRFAAKEWDSTEWKEWLPDPSPEFAARIGTLAISADDLRSSLAGVDFDFKLPALIPFAEGRCLLLDATGEAKDAAAEAIQSVAIRALANTPPGKARFTLIDPVGLGQNVADFMHLGDFNRDLINGKAWSEPQHIEQQLTKLTEDMETVIQTFLRKQFATIQEYNKEHHEVAEPFRFLVIFDFPVNFTESSARRLVSIVKNGPRCGVYTLILMDSSKKFPYGFDIEELRQLAVVFESDRHISGSINNKVEALPAQPILSNHSEEKFVLVLKSVPADKKIAVIKALREINAALDLAGAKQLVESAPQTILEGVTKEEANTAKRTLEQAGAIANVASSESSGEPTDAEAQFKMGLSFVSDDGGRRDYALAALWFRKAAEQGNPKAQYFLGLLYEGGKGIAQDDYAAVEWFRAAAEQGHSSAQCSLGLCYFRGNGIGEDQEIAAQWFQKGAENGDPEAQCKLALCYAGGLGVAEDENSAEVWFRKAAEQGDSEAQYRLGVYCSEVIHDLDEAAQWLRKAAEQGHEEAQEALEGMSH